MQQVEVAGLTILGNVSVENGFNATIGLTRPQGNKKPKEEAFISTENLFDITTESGDFLIIFQ
jgi:hypothetical protein